MEDESSIAAGTETNTLWVVHKDEHTMTCVLSGRPGHEELRVLVDRDLYLSETHTVHEGAVDRAHALYRGLEAHGWKPVVATSKAQE
jgi:hypothetical protein